MIPQYRDDRCRHALLNCPPSNTSWLGLGPQRRGHLLICARRLDRFLGWLPASHLSLVLAYSSAPSQWDEYEGAPTRAVPGAYGPIVVRKHAFRPRLDRTYLRLSMREYADLPQVEAILDRTLRRVNESQVQYEPLVGPNSNTVVRTFLLELGLPPLQPAAVARVSSTKALSSSAEWDMQISTGPVQRIEPHRHIDWVRQTDEQAVSDQIWAALASNPEQRDRSGVWRFLEQEGLKAAEIDDGRVVYAYADGRSEPGSPVECEWYLEFRFDGADHRLGELAVEKRLVGP